VLKAKNKDDDGYAGKHESAKRGDGFWWHADEHGECADREYEDEPR